MLGVGSELASQSQRESARLEVQPLLDPNKHTSEVQANQRNDHTTDNDEYESVSVIERPVAQCRICGSPFSTKGNCTTHEKQTPYCREKIKELEQHAQSNPTLTAAPPANVQLPDYDCYTLSRFCSNTDKLALDKAYNYTTISFVLRQKLHRILTDSLVNSNSRNPNRRNTPSFWKKTSQLKFVNCDQQSPGNLLFKLQAKLFKDLKTTTTMFQGCSSQNKKHLRNLSVSIRIQRTFSSLRCQPAS
ncbi:Hypothetical_protein [Hexamita inflata]|uniref:Hypothetical_protein n=1 Tax=Hexamita inflata TaxID=28002 RepID=A0AA86P2X7_9EUKA|nr:Hypothetical protein HINF_LOCUS18321 [Hexamita inflata]